MQGQCALESQFCQIETQWKYDGEGTCIDVPADGACDLDVADAQCGCDGTMYRNACERQSQRVNEDTTKGACKKKSLELFMALNASVFRYELDSTDLWYKWERSLLGARSVLDQTFANLTRLVPPLYPCWRSWVDATPHLASSPISGGNDLLHPGQDPIFGTRVRLLDGEGDETIVPAKIGDVCDCYKCQWDPAKPPKPSTDDPLCSSEADDPPGCDFTDQTGACFTGADLPSYMNAICDCASQKVVAKICKSSWQCALKSQFCQIEVQFKYDGLGTCIDVPTDGACDLDVADPQCGCDGTMYRNVCERQSHRVSEDTTNEACKKKSLELFMALNASVFRYELDSTDLWDLWEQSLLGARSVLDQTFANQTRLVPDQWQPDPAHLPRKLYSCPYPHNE